jgi:predicted RNA-binding Zn ribbon-like protein
MARFEEADIPVHVSDFACIDLINSEFTDYLGDEPRRDRIASPRWQRWFLDRHGLGPQDSGSVPLDELVALRRDLRRILEKWARNDRLSPGDVRALDRRIGAAPLRQRVAAGSGGVELLDEPLHPDWPWVLASVTTSAVDLMLTGDWKRVKTCSNPNCSWMFYDTTVNRSKRYCSPTPCASLIRVRRFRDAR